jgi:hypothetical protein
MTDIAPTPARSTFVTAVAVTFIVLSAGSTLIGIMQNLMFGLLLPADAFDMSATAPPEGMPGFMVFMMSHMRLVFALVLALSAGTLVVSIGLLKRKAWARPAFIGVMALGIAWNLLGLVLQHSMMNFIGAQPIPVEGGAPDFRSIMVVMQVFSLLFALAMSAAFGWIIYKLLQPQIAAEFA